MDAQTLSEAMGCSLARATEMLPGMNNAMIAAQINTPLRAAHWCSQIGHESVGLQYMEEIASGAAYNGRADLGNTQPGDGPRYKGSGPIQLTGRSNFRSFTQWANRQGHTTLNFEDQPHLVRQEPKWGFLAASWYWTVARPQLNALCDADNLEGVTRAINGGTNGITDRRNRLERCKRLGARLLPTGGGGTVSTIEKRLDYPRDEVHQDTGWNCGPASVQTIIRAAKGRLITEANLARELGTHRGGTDWIGSFPAVLNNHIATGRYVHAEMPQDPPAQAQRNTLWDRVRASVDAGHGVVANIVSPPSNRPRPSYKSTQALQYSGGTVYHYVACLGYAVDGSGTRHVWIADSGFRPYGSWITLDNLATLIPPKGYAYSTAPSKNPAPDPVPEKKEDDMSDAMNVRYNGFVDPEITGTVPDWVRHADRNSFQALVETRMLRDEVRDLNAKFDRLLGDQPT